MPSVPYRGIRPFRYEDHPIFFAREREAERLASLVSVYRGAMLYGETGAGKSSLINAGLLPRAVELGFHPERVRVQPRAGEALVVEPLGGGDDAGRTVLSTAEFEQMVEAACALQRPLLVFDQFEELVTLFDAGPEAGALRRQIVELLVRLLRSPLPVKLLFVFREDYLGKVKELLRACPELVDQALQLAPLAVETLPTIVRGPFERYPGHFARELDPALAARLEAALAERFASGELSLSEVQTVCLRLWQADDPHRLLAERGVQGLLEDYLGEALDAFPPQTRFAAVALLAQMVTAAGTRNVIAAEDLVQRVREEDPSFAPALLLHALDRLDRESRLVRHERRRDLDLYEITSEFLVPWISERRVAAQRLRERRRDRRRLLALGAVAVVLAAVVGVVVWFAVSASHERDRAERSARTAMALALAAASHDALADRPDVSLLLALGAFETDRRLATRDALATALWRLRSTGLTGLMGGHEGIVNAVAIGPDGGTIASGGDDGTVRLWSARTHRRLGAPLTGHRRRIADVAFADDGATLVSGAVDGTVRRWDVASHRQLGDPLKVGRKGVAALAVHGRMLVTATWDAKARFWDRSTGRRLGPVLRLSASPSMLALSRDGRLLAVGGDDGRVGLWRLGAHAGRGAGAAATLHAHAIPLAQPAPFGASIATVAFGASDLLAAGYSDGTVRIWDGRSGAKRGASIHAAPRSGVASVAFAHDGRTLAAATEDGRVTLWDVASRRACAASFRATTDWIRDVEFAPGDRTLAMAGGDGMVAVWPMRARRFPRTLAPQRRAVTAVAYSPDGTLLASASWYGPVRLSSVATGRQVGVLDGTRAMWSVAFSPDGRLLAVAREGRALLWNVARRRLVARLPASKEASPLIAFSRDGSALAVGDAAGVARVWDVARRTLRGAPLRAAGAISALALSSDGSRLVTAASGGRIRVWEPGARRPLRRIYDRRDNTVTALAVSPDGLQLASAGTDSTLRLWRLADGAPLAGLRGHDVSGLEDVQYSPGGRLLATAGLDGAVRLWAVRGHRALGEPLRGHRGWLSRIAFGADGTSLVANLGNAVQIWRGVLWDDFARLRDEVCGVVGGGLTRPEWQRVVPDVPYMQTCPE